MDEDMDTSVDVDTSDVDVGDDIDTSDVSEDVPEDIPEDFDEDVGDEIPDEADDLDDDIPEDVPEDVPVDEDDDLGDDIPEDMPEDAPVDEGDDLDGDIPEDVPEDAPVDEGDDLDGDIPEDVPEDVPVDEGDDLDGDIPEDAPVDAGDNLDGDIPEDAPEDTPVDAANDLDNAEADELPADAQDDAAAEAEDAVSDMDGAETDEQPADAQDDATAEAEDAASDMDGAETDEQPADAQDDAVAEAEDAASDMDGAETDEQPAAAQDDAVAEAEDAASDMGGAETDEQPAAAQDDAAAEAEDAASDMDGAETDEQPADTQDDAVAKAEGIFAETDNTDYSADDSSLSGESEWSEDDQQLWDNDFGAVNKDAIDYNDPDYINDGIIKPDWGQESVDTPERTVLPEGTRIVQYSHPDQSGVHFAPEGTEYEDLQLPDSQDKRVENVYEVQEGGLPVDSSEIAVQPWNKTGDSDEGTGTKQFVSDETADALVEQGKLKPVNDAVSSADDYAGVYGEIPSAADTPQSVDLTPAQSLSEYMNKHNYGPDDFAEYSQDPQWRELQKQAYPDYELPPLSEESARSQLSNYMNEHNYGPDDFAEYSQDPQWRELQKQAYPDYELPPRNDADNIGRWSDIPADMAHKENLDATNPNYETGDEWQVNCQRCVPTYEMRSRGYDVTAQPCVDSEDYLAYHPYDVWDGADVRYASGDGITDIQSAMNDWGDGSRAQVCLQWENGDGGHTFMAEQRDGRTHFVDPQTGDEDVSWYFSEARPGTVSFCRTDQLMPSSRILDCCKGAKR